MIIQGYDFNPCAYCGTELTLNEHDNFDSDKHISVRCTKCRFSLQMSNTHLLALIWNSLQKEVDYSKRYWVFAGVTTKLSLPLTFENARNLENFIHKVKREQDRATSAKLKDQINTLLESN